MSEARQAWRRDVANSAVVFGSPAPTAGSAARSPAATYAMGGMDAGVLQTSSRSARSWGGADESGGLHASVTRPTHSPLRAAASKAMMLTPPKPGGDDSRVPAWRDPTNVPAGASALPAYASSGAYSGVVGGAARSLSPAFSVASEATFRPSVVGSGDWGSIDSDGAASRLHPRAVSGTHWTTAAGSDPTAPSPAKWDANMLSMVHAIASSAARELVLAQPLHNEVADLRMQLVAAHQKVADVSARCSHLEASLAAARESQQHTSMKVQQIVNEALTNRENAGSAVGGALDASSLDARVAAVASEVRDASASLAALSAGVNDANAQRSIWQASTSARMHDLERTVSHAMAQLGAMEERIMDHMRRGLDDAMRDISGANTTRRFARLETAAATLQGESAASRQQLVTLSHALVQGLQSEDALRHASMQRAADTERQVDARLHTIAQHVRMVDERLAHVVTQMHAAATTATTAASAATAAHTTLQALQSAGAAYSAWPGTTVSAQARSTEHAQLSSPAAFRPGKRSGAQDELSPSVMVPDESDGAARSGMQCTPPSAMLRPLAHVPELLISVPITPAAGSASGVRMRGAESGDVAVGATNMISMDMWRREMEAVAANVCKATTKRLAHAVSDELDAAVGAINELSDYTEVSRCVQFLVDTVADAHLMESAWRVASSAAYACLEEEHSSEHMRNSKAAAQTAAPAAAAAAAANDASAARSHERDDGADADQQHYQPPLDVSGDASSAGGCTAPSDVPGAGTTTQAVGDVPTTAPSGNEEWAPPTLLRAALTHAALQPSHVMASAAASASPASLFSPTSPHPRFMKSTRNLLG